MRAGGLPTILWDFDGTLAQSHHIWSGTLLKLLNEHEPGHSVEREQISCHLQQGFPWHEPDVPHPELSHPGDWWRAVEAVFAKTYQAVGLERQRAMELSRLVRQRIIDPCNYHLYVDTIWALEFLADRGWSHIILSNHVPELERIVSSIGLGKLIKKCISSAVIGYEKPHPMAFRIALEVAHEPTQVWMVGDNLIADVRGAEAVGIPAILVHRPRPDGILYYAADLREAARLIDQSSSRRDEAICLSEP